jgi:hypothetical protein
MKTRKPRLVLRPEVDEQIRIYTDLASGEFSALGLVEQTHDGFVVTDIFLLEQVCTPGSTELDPISIGNLMQQLTEEGKDTGALTFWVHSHGSSGVFWSATDNRCIDDFRFSSYSISLVVNKAGDRLARFDLFNPVRITVDDLPVEVRSETTGLLEFCREEFLGKVDEQHSPMLYGAPSGQRFLRDDLLLPHWSDEDFDDPGPFTEVAELEEQYMEGDLGWEEYCRRLKALGEGR